MLEEFLKRLATGQSNDDYSGVIAGMEFGEDSNLMFFTSAHNITVNDNLIQVDGGGDLSLKVSRNQIQSIRKIGDNEIPDDYEFDCGTFKLLMGFV